MPDANAIYKRVMGKWCEQPETLSPSTHLYEKCAYIVGRSIVMAAAVIAEAIRNEDVS